MPYCRLSPWRAHAACIWVAIACSPPKRWAQPVISSISASGGCSATHGENRVAQRRNRAKNACISPGAWLRVTRSGHIACASRKGWPGRTPNSDAATETEATTCICPLSATITNGSTCPLAPILRSTDSAPRRGNHRERARFAGIFWVTAAFVPILFLHHAPRQVEPAPAPAPKGPISAFRLFLHLMCHFFGQMPPNAAQNLPESWPSLRWRALAVGISCLSPQSPSTPAQNDI